NSYGDIKYVLNEEEYVEQEANDFFVKRFISGFGKMVVLYQRTYSENNYNQTMSLAIDFITKDWEKYVLASFKFTQFGALRLDKDIRALSSYLSSMTRWTSREKWARLNQISTVLNFEKPTEILDSWGAKAGGITWRLTVGEVRKIMALRSTMSIAINFLSVNFKPDDIAKLKL
ncbi:hypothetical protein BDK51DRAFT_31028, partial [Blyttiomyces helicus]